MLIGYARVSTVEQDSALQREALRKAGCERVFEETASGARADRPELLRAMDHLRKGDVLVVWKLDRLARSLQQLIETVASLEQAGVELRSLTEKIDTSTPGGRFFFHIFGAVAEFERSLLRERTLAGLASAKARGKKGGRPKSLDAEKVKLARTMLANPDYTRSFVAAHLGIGRTTLYRALREHEGQPKERIEFASLAEFAAAIRDLTKGPTTKPFTNRLAIAEAYDRGEDFGLALGSLDEFKQKLAAAAREGLLELERCEVAGTMAKPLFLRSRLGLGRDERHFIVRGAQ